MDTAIVILCIVIAVIVSGGLCSVLFFKIGVKYRKQIAEAEIGSAEDQAARILQDAGKEAAAQKKQALIEAKDDIYKLRNEAEGEIKDRRNEVLRQERRLQQKEETLDRKLEAHEKKEEQLQEKLKQAEEHKKEAKEYSNQQQKLLETISGFTAAQAKEYLLKRFDGELTHEKAVRLASFEQQLKDESEQKAHELIGLAISRCAADHASEVTVSVVSLPNDDMKGRIIGREGRNIRAIETLTGVDLIIDDTPETITLSCFDPVRREIARLTLERLISDGRIHPARIEETIERCRREVDNTIKVAGANAVIETNVRGINHELVRLIGRLKFRTSYGQNVLSHSIETAQLCGMLAGELHLDVNTAKRAGLLHDIGKALNHEIEGSHVQIGVEVCKKYKEPQPVIHAIEAHHNDIEPQTLLACIVQAADAISAARPGARRENLENYIKRLEQLEEIANSFQGVENSYAIQAGREIRIMIKPDVIRDEKMPLVAREIVKRIEQELSYPGQVKVHLIRESRTIDFAK